MLLFGHFLHLIRDGVQAVVERMVGIKHLESPTEARRRL